MIEASSNATHSPPRVRASFAFALATLPVGRLAFDPERDFGTSSFLALLVVALGIGLAALGRSVRGRVSLADSLPMLCLSLPIAGGLDLIPAMLIGSSAALATIGVSCGRIAITRWLHEQPPSLSQNAIGFALLVVTYYLVRFDPPSVRHLTEGLDDSWRQGLGHALSSGLRFGHDIVFNQGPLGYFRESPPHPELFAAKLLWWEGAYKLAAAIVSLLPVLVLRGPLIKTLYCLALLLPSSGPDGAVFVSIAAGSFYLLHRFGERSLLATNGIAAIADRLVVVVIAIALLVKFTYFGLAVACLGAVGLRLLIAGRATRALEVVIVVGLVFVWTWLACGQRIDDIPSYLRGSLAIARGYNIAMVEFGSELEVDLAIDIAIVAALLAFAHLFANWRTGRAVALCECAIVLVTLLLTFKAGFTRHYGSSVLFFNAVCFAPLLLAGSRSSSGSPFALLLARLRPILAVTLLALGCLGMAFARNQSPSELPLMAAEAGARIRNSIVALDDWRYGRLEKKWRDAWSKHTSSSPIKSIQSEVLAGTVDVLGARQGVVFASSIRWQPRPIFQSYSAYETSLLERNAQFYRGRKPPDFVLLEGDNLDERLPTACDTLALQEVLRRYDPVEFEYGFVLMRRSQQPRPERPREVLLATLARFGEWVDFPPIDHGCRALHIEFEPTIAARVQSFFFHIDLPRMDVELTDGTTGQFRLVPDAMRAGALIDPICLYGADWQRFFSSHAWPRPKRIRLLPPVRATGAYGHGAEIRLVRADDLLPLNNRANPFGLEFPSFQPLPTSSETSKPATVVRVGDFEATVLHPPSVLTFDLVPGRYRLKARIGILEDAWKDHETDGVSFLIGIDGARQATLLERLIDPRSVERDRIPQEIDLEFELGLGEVLKIATTFGNAGDSSYDWAYLGPVMIRSASNTK